MPAVKLIHLKNHGLFGSFSKVDAEDYHAISSQRWRWQGGYAVRGGGAGGEPFISMHRAILGIRDGFDIDHINGDKLDNRRCNLRYATEQENTRNCRARHPRSDRSSTTPWSHFKGVRWSPGTGKLKPWGAAIRVSGRSRHLGRFATAEEAAHAYDRAARELFLEFAAYNFPADGERSAINHFQSKDFDGYNSPHFAGYL